MSKNTQQSTKIRCAIYTRKSSDEGLEQEFNSLDAQYEACESYIASQKHEGWVLVKKRYDDGGVSGGTMERAGLNTLLKDIDQGLIDMIVVYKIDRLTRSLMDFSKIIERLDKASASFVSVTQSFNTATSMGRLTLNMLLYFAQFEREVTAERIRDKIAASKAKGLWMGGTTPMGYQPHPDPTIRGLIMDDVQAEKVRRLFCLYDKFQCLTKVEEMAQKEGITRKNKNAGLNDKATAQSEGADTDSSQPYLSQSYLSRGAIHKILINPIYIGKVKHKELLYDGRHEAIINCDLWQRVQDKLQMKSAKKRGSQNNTEEIALFKSKLFDETGEHLTPTHTIKNKKIIRYYISSRLLNGKDPSAWRLPAQSFEETLMKAFNEKVSDYVEQSTFAKQQTSIQEIKAQKKQLDLYLKDSPHKRAQVIKRINLKTDQITLHIDTALLFQKLSLPQSEQQTDMTFILPMTLRKRGVEQKLIIGQKLPEQDQALIKSLVKAHQWLNTMKQGQTFASIATQENINESYIRSRIPLAFLSPKLQKAILNGNQPIDLTLEKLVRCKIPLDWAKQEQLFMQ
ncbi:recombinase family protein [Bartonella tamiae]|uniref:recombinase family protein n=1 Tax=Bartonella tamiae TaxID=373638 RepID=UPI00026E73DD|nr:recombinase family protein [Bartonella tamiae]EJF93761.1 hypothetical protein MEG_01185 [Bartonella tamiae Th307]